MFCKQLVYHMKSQAFSFKKNAFHNPVCNLPAILSPHHNCPEMEYNLSLVHIVLCVVITKINRHIVAVKSSDYFQGVRCPRDTVQSPPRLVELWSVRACTCFRDWLYVTLKLLWPSLFFASGHLKLVASSQLISGFIGSVSQLIN